MLNANNQVKVKYANGAVRVRRCQSTVIPTAAELGPVRSINDWYFLMKVHADIQVHAHAAIDAHIEMESLLQDVKEHLQKTA